MGCRMKVCFTRTSDPPANPGKPPAARQEDTRRCIWSSARVLRYPTGSLEHGCFPAVIQLHTFREHAYASAANFFLLLHSDETTYAVTSYILLIAAGPER